MPLRLIKIPCIQLLHHVRAVSIRTIFFLNFFIEGGEVYVCVGAVGVEGDTNTDSCSLWTQYQQSSVSVLPLRDTWLSGR